MSRLNFVETSFASIAVSPIFGLNVSISVSTAFFELIQIPTRQRSSRNCVACLSSPMLVILFLSSGQASQAVSSWDLPSQTTLKFRKAGQNSAAELRKRDVRAEVEDSERRALDEKPAAIGRRYGETETTSSVSVL